MATTQPPVTPADTALAPEVPIACTLGAGDFKARVAWIADLNAQALRDSRRDDLTLHLVYAPGALARVRQMVEQEQACCAFLAFDLREDSGAVHLTITAPERTRETAEAVFAPFQPKSGSAPTAGCGCCADPAT